MILEHIIITACCCLKMVTWNAKSAWAVRMEDFELHGHQHINVYITHYFQNNNNNNNNNNNISLLLMIFIKLESYFCNNH